MVQKSSRLTAAYVKTATKVGYHGDGDGLYLMIVPRGTKSWIYRFQLRGRRRDMGLGGVDLVTLAEARRLAMDARRLVMDGIDPIDARIDEQERAAAELARATTFRAAAEAYIAIHRDGWKNAKHAAQWESSLARYVYPRIGALPVTSISVAQILEVLRPIWMTKTETASRVRQRIESILDAAAVHGGYQAPNPARWKNHLELMLPAKARVAPVSHHNALPYVDMPGLYLRLRGAEGIAARALEFAILTAARTGEVLGATWDEIDMADGVWRIPGTRMKAGWEHRVSLSAAALDILARMRLLRRGAYVFPGQRRSVPLSQMSMTMVLRRLGRGDLTVHGFRSTFRDWVAEATDYPGEVAEMALAHRVSDKVEAAYRRGDLLEKRRRLAADWAAFCMSGSPAAGAATAGAAETAG